MRTVLIVATLLATTAGSSFAQGKPVKPTDPTTTAIAPLTIVDATGKAVGLYQAPYLAIFRYNGVPIAIGIQRDGQGQVLDSAKLQYAPQVSFHATPDCSGLPIPTTDNTVYSFGTPTNITGTRAVAYIKSNDGTVTAYIASSGLPTLRSWGSSRLTDGRCSVTTEGALVYGYNVETTVILPPAPLTVQ